MEGLDEYQAFQLDLALAVKGMLRDKEAQNDNIYTLLQGMRGIMKAQGAKPGKIPKPKPLVNPPVDERIPTLRDVLEAFGGAGTSVEGL
jgi:hypothetical protein